MSKENPQDPSGKYGAEIGKRINFCPHCGTAVLREMHFGKVRPVCPNCGWIYFADPKVAAAVLLENDGRVLLVRRSNEPYRGTWTLPAGFVNAGEDPAQAAERECLEETGLQVEITGILDIYAGREHSRGSDFVIIYRAKIIGGELAAGDDADEVGWFLTSSLPRLAFESTRIILNSK